MPNTVKPNIDDLINNNEIEVLKWIGEDKGYIPSNGKTFIDKEDIANMVVFLLSDEAKKISGQVMTVDGNTERMN